MEYVSICVFGLIFYQRNIHRRKKWFPERSFAGLAWLVRRYPPRRSPVLVIRTRLMTVRRTCPFTSWAA